MREGDKLVALLKEEQMKHAVDALKRPRSNVDVAYAYGQAVGIYMGLELAIERVLKMYQDERDEELLSWNNH